MKKILLALLLSIFIIPSVNAITCEYVGISNSNYVIIKGKSEFTYYDYCNDCSSDPDKKSYNGNDYNNPIKRSIDSIKTSETTHLVSECPNYVDIIINTGTVTTSNDRYECGANADDDCSYKLAASSSSGETEDNNGLSGASPYEEPKNCEGVLGSPETVGEPAYYLQTAFDVIKYIALVALVILTVADIAKTVMSENKDMSKELTRKLFLRLIYAICIFFVPIIVNIIMKVTGAYDSCNIS